MRAGLFFHAQLPAPGGVIMLQGHLPMPVTEIKKDIYWVGVVDWNIHDFHGYSRSPQGTTYNAYLVMDEKITLFDSVPAKFQTNLF